MRLKRESVIEWLKILKTFQRPVRAIVWSNCLLFTFIGCVTGFIPCSDNNVIQTILYIMGADLGVYTVSRTYEKAKISPEVLKDSEAN